MIILATISINAVLGENGIIGKAEKAKMIQSHGEVTEAIKLAYVDYEFEQMTGETAKIEETKLASVETGIKLAATNNETFLEYLIRKGYTDENGVVNVENLLGNSTGVGNGSGNTDVYKIEETDDGKYELNYYDKEEDKTKLTEINKNGEIVEVGKEPEKYAYSFKAGDDITAYVIDNGDETYDMIFVGTGEMYDMFLWQCPDIFNTVDMCGGTANVSYKITIKNVKISEGVTNIGQYAFYGCSSLTSIEIPDSVTNIGQYAFVGCSSLTSIEIPNSVTSIGDSAFRECSSLTSIEIPDSVTSIGLYAFYGCSNLTSIEIPNSVTSIGGYAFEDCRSLTSIEIPDSVTNIGQFAFYGCSGLESIKVDENNPVYDSRNNCNAIIKTTDNELIKGCKNTQIPDSVTSIGGYAFEDCRSLTSIEIPDSVTNIGDDAFYGCSSLRSIEIPDSVTNIGQYAFYGCSSLTTVNYRGTEEQWNAIEISSSGNDPLTSATKNYNYAGE